MGYLGARLTQVFTRECEWRHAPEAHGGFWEILKKWVEMRPASGEDTRGRSGRVTQRCHNSPRWETGIANANDVKHRKRAEDFGKKVSRVETRHRTRRVDFRLLAEALGRCRAWWRGADEKASKERLCLSLSLCRKTFKLKGNKKFRIWTEKS